LGVQFDVGELRFFNNGGFASEKLPDAFFLIDWHAGNHRALVGAFGLLSGWCD
jgi:hypothetical protein